MRYDTPFSRAPRSVFVRGTQVAALCLATATAATAQSAKTRVECIQVGGTVMTNFIDETTTLGTATGDLRGAVSADLLGQPSVEPDGTTVFTVQHHWTTEAGDTISLQVARARATQVAPGLYAVLSYLVTIRGGTGRFAEAYGTVSNIGEVDLTTLRTVFRYSGQVCFGPSLK